MSDLWCCFGLHRWMRWSEPRPQEYERPAFALYGNGLTSYTATETVEYTVMEQSRACETCGIAQRREVPRA